MRIGKYNIRADSHQFILEEVSTVKDEKSKNFGNETLINPSYHSWKGVVKKLIKLELMASVNEFDGIADVIQRFELSMINLSDEAKKQLGR